MPLHLLGSIIMASSSGNRFGIFMQQRYPPAIQRTTNQHDHVTTIGWVCNNLGWRIPLMHKNISPPYLVLFAASRIDAGVQKA